MIVLFQPYKDTRIYLYSFKECAWIYVFPDKENVLKFIAADIYFHGTLGSYQSEYLDNINCNGNDLVIWRIPHYSQNLKTNESICWIEEKVFVKPYMFVDAYDRILDFRSDYKQILEYVKNENCVDYKCYPQPKWQKKNRYKPALPTYRQEPVPYTGHYGSGSMFRHPKTFQEMRLNTDPEYKQFVRPSRRKCHLPQVYDDIFRPHPKSWKDCTKRRHQYKEKSDEFSSDFSYLQVKYLGLKYPVH